MARARSARARTPSRVETPPWVSMPRPAQARRARGWSRPIIAIASEPDAAARTWSPRLSSAFSTTFLTLRLSSTTRTFPIDVLLQNWRDGRVGAALVDSGGRAQQELLEIAMDRLHAV